MFESNASPTNIYLDQTGQVHFKGPDEPVHWRLSAYMWVPRQGEVLMVKSRWRDLWELPGGGAEPSESLVMAAKRETFEETGYQVEVVSKMPTFMSEGNFYVLEEERFYHSVRFFFLGRPGSSEAVAATARDEGEIVDVAWRRVEQLNAHECNPLHWEAISRMLYG